MLTRCRRRGLTLIEMVISLSMLTVILAGSISLVLIAARAMSNESSNVGADAVAARSAADQIIDDLKTATAITEQTRTAIKMTVPDRDGDGLADTIRYAWSGTTGAPLTRQFNARTAATLATNVNAFSFTYLSKTAGKPPPVEGPSQTLLLHLASSNTMDTDLSSAKGVAGYFKPTLAAKAVKWKISKIDLQTERDLLSTGTVTVALKYADANKKPTGATLQSATVAIVDLLGSSNWTSVTFNTPADLDISQSVCFTVTASVLLGNGGRIRYDNANTDASTVMMITSDSGATWTTPVATQALQARVTGTVTTQELETLEFQALPAAP